MPKPPPYTASPVYEYDPPAAAERLFASVYSILTSVPERREAYEFPPGGS